MEINIYTMPECPYCTHLKELLDEMDIEYNSFNIFDEEVEKMFDKLMEISGGDSVPMITVGKHLLAPEINFNTIEEAVNIIDHIIKTEGS